VNAPPGTIWDETISGPLRVRGISFGGYLVPNSPSRSKLFRDKTGADGTTTIVTGQNGISRFRR
jgi:hypothetical protein